MPKDEFDFDDPMELNGVALVSSEDTMDTMAECFIEEFMRMGHNHKQLLALFRNPHYIGMNMILQNRGEAFVKDKIEEIFARWGRKVEWPAPAEQLQQKQNATQEIPLESGACDPTGAAIPKLNP